MDFIEELFLSECYFRIHWKIYCPGCGGTRAFYALLQGNVIQSVKYNPIVILFLADVFITLIFDAIESRTNGKYCTARLRIFVNTFLLLFIIIYFFFRNYLLWETGIDMLGDFE